MSDLIDAYLTHLRAAGRSPETRRVRGTVLRSAAAALPGGLDHPTVDELEVWLGQPGRAAWTRYSYFEHLACFYAWAVRCGHLSWSPTDRMVRPRPPRCAPHPATEEQLAQALTLPRPWRTAIVLAAYAGLRAMEISTLHRQDVHRDWLAARRKGGAEQLLPTHDRIWAEVADLPAGPLVRTRTGRPYSPANLSAAASAHLTRIGLPAVTLHCFRHRFATLALLPKDQGGAGADVRTVQELLGHASLASTQVYTQVTDRQRRAAIAALP